MLLPIVQEASDLRRNHAYADQRSLCAEELPLRFQARQLPTGHQWRSTLPEDRRKIPKDRHGELGLSLKDAECPDARLEVGTKSHSARYREEL